MSDMPNYIKPKIRRSIDLPFLLERKESSKPKDHDAVKKNGQKFCSIWLSDSPTENVREFTQNRIGTRSTANKPVLLSSLNYLEVVIRMIFKL